MMVIESFKEEGRLRRIEATIWVERDSQKAIVIGKGGALLKRISSAARKDMERHQKNLPDRDLAYFSEGSDLFDDYIEAVEWAQRAERLGAGEILLTSMDKDGTRDGYDLELTRAISSSVRIPVIASGGAGQLEHFYEALTEGGASAVLAASLFHFGQYKIAEVKDYLRARGVVMR